MHVYQLMKTQCGSEDEERSLKNLILTRITPSTIARSVIRNGLSSLLMHYPKLLPQQH